MDSGMFDLQETRRWATLYLIHSLSSGGHKNTAHSICCFGQIFVENNEQETALNLFRVALDEFSIMGVHQWKADCMLRMAEIFERRGDTANSVEMWRAAIPVLQRCSQAQSMARVEAKLATVGSDSPKQTPPDNPISSAAARTADALQNPHPIPKVIAKLRGNLALMLDASEKQREIWTEYHRIGIILFK
jgi:hypothetical protein